MMAGRAWWPEQEAAGHIASAARTGDERWHFSQAGTPVYGMVFLTFRPLRTSSVKSLWKCPDSS